MVPTVTSDRQREMGEGQRGPGEREPGGGKRGLGNDSLDVPVVEAAVEGEWRGREGQKDPAAPRGQLRCRARSLARFPNTLE